MKIVITESQYNFLIESKVNLFSSEPSSLSNYSPFTFSKVSDGYYQVLALERLPSEFYDYVSSLGDDLKNEIMGHFTSRMYIEASGEFNRIHFREGVHPQLQGIGLGYLIYQDFIKFLGFASTSDSATKESQKVWSKIINDPDFYGVVCEDHRIMAISKDWSGDVVSVVKSFIRKNKLLYLNSDLLNDYPELSSYSENNINESIDELTKYNLFVDMLNDIIKNFDDINCKNASKKYEKMYCDNMKDFSLDDLIKKRDHFKTKIESLIYKDTYYNY